LPKIVASTTPGHQHVVDLGRIGRGAAAIEHVFRAVDDAHEAIGIDRAHVARMPEGGRELACPGLRTGQVGGHDDGANALQREPCGAERGPVADRQQHAVADVPACAQLQCRL